MKTSHDPIADEKVRAALHDFLQAADTANETAGTLANAILDHRKALIAEATISREAATLLLHAAQTLGRTVLAALADPGKSEALHVS